MTTNEIQAIKRNGLKKVLLDRSSDRIWAARQLLNETVPGNSKTFLEKLLAVRQALSDAEQLYEEAEKII